MIDLLIVILLVVFGVLLLLAELFLLPGFGIAGISGIGCLIASVVVAYMTISHLAGHITLAIVFVLSVIAVVVFLKSHALEKMALDTKIDSKVSMPEPGKKLDNLKK